MELRHISYFLAVAAEQNFTRAAEHVGIGQPSLSLQIRDLERAVEARLFHRIPQGAELWCSTELSPRIPRRRAESQRKSDGAID